MLLRVSAIALGLGALSTSAFALTIQAAPPRPDVAQHLRPASPTGFVGVLPGPGELQGSYLAPGRSRPIPTNGGTTSFSFGSVRGSTTVSPDYGASRFDTRRDDGNPLSLTLPRR